MKKIYLGVFWLFIVVGLIISTGSREVSATGEVINCALCHEQTDPGEDLADLNSCKICHETEHSEPRGELTTTVYGQFLSADSLYKNLEELERLHDGQNPRGSTQDCYQCHGVVERQNFTGPQDSPKGVKAHDLNSIHSLNLVGPSGLNCTSAGCHVGRLDTEHLARVRVDGQNYDCTVCHGVTGNETSIVYIRAYKDTINQMGSVDNWVCEKCHTTHTEYYSFHDNGTEQPCTKCHSKNLVREHKPRAVDCNQCHNNRDLQVQQAIDQGKANCLQCHTKPELHQDTPVDCAGCHDEKAGAMSLAGYSYVKRQETCVVCHGEHPFKIETISVVVDGTAYGYFKSVYSFDYSSQEIHNNHYKTFTKPLGPSCRRCHGSGVEDSGSGFISCYACHDQVAHETHYQPSNRIPKSGASIEGIVAKVVDGKNHPESSDNMLTANLTCLTAECHGAQKTNLRLENQGKELCLNCHNSPVETVKSFEVHDLPTHHTTGWPVIEDFNLACNVCHNGMNDISTHVGKSNHQGQDMSCFTCHNATYQSVIDQNQTACVNCHPIDASKQNIHSDWRPKHESRELPTEPAVDCSRCHHIDLVQEHDARGKNCEACHKSTAPVVVTAIREGDVRCIACHSSGFQKLHVDSTPECSTCHQEKTETMTFRGYTFVYKQDRCQVCHTLDLSGHEQSDLQTVTVNGKVYGSFKGVNSIGYTSKQLHSTHYGVSRPGLNVECMKCHGIGEAGADSGFIACSACHGKVGHGDHFTASGINPKTGQSIFVPQVDVVDGTEQPDSENNSAKTNLTCLTSECHGTSTTNIVLRTSSNNPLCWNCHNSPTAKAKDKTGHGNTESDHTTAWPEKDNQDCASCHPGMDIVSTGHQGVTSSEGFVDCQICHGSTIPKVEAAITNQAISCENCHSLHGTVEEIHKVTLSESCTTCHQASLETEHPLHQDDNGTAYDCNTCHKSTKENVKSAIANRDKRCEACHANAGGHNHPVAADGFAANSQVNCGKCHGNTEANSGELVKIHQDAATAGRIANFSCDLCHTDLFVGEDKVITNDGSLDMQKNGESTIYCIDCHNGDLAHGLSEKYPAHNGDHINAEGYGSYKGTHNGSDFDDSKVACNKCHPTLDTKVVHDAKVHANVNCNSCHLSDNPKVQDVISGAWSRAESKSNYTCASCHNTLPYLHQKDHLATSKEQVSCAACHDGQRVKGNFNASAGEAVNVADAQIHSDCNKCHGSNNSTVVKFIYDQTGIQNPVYNCEDCHREAGITPKHDKLHTVTKYLPDSDTDCSGCHSKDVAVTHKNAESGCDVCHGTSPNLDNTKDVIFANLSSNEERKGFTCQACHTNAGGHDHPVVKNGFASASDPQVNCSTCHATNENGTSDLVKVHQEAAKQGKIVKFECVLCHNSTFEGSDKVIVQDGTIDMKKHKATMIYCTDCHNGTLADALGTKYPAHDGDHINATDYGSYKGTYDGKAFDDSGVDCSKCHASKDTKLIHDPAVHANVNCNSCHMSDNAEVKGVIKGAWSRAENKATYTCASCHNTLPYLHKKNHLAQSTDQVVCNTCHNGTIIVSEFNAPNGHPTDVVNLHSTCNKCHTSDIATVSNYIYNNLGQDNPAYNCEDCHKEKALDDVRQIGKHNKLHTVNSFLPGSDENCGACHDKDVTAVHKTGKGTAEETSNCDACHIDSPKLANTQNVIADNLSIKADRAGYTCKSCHDNAGNHTHPVAADGFAANSQVNCGKCHGNTEANSGELVKIHQDAATAGRIATFSCDLCHNDLFVGEDKVITNDGSLDMQKNGESTIYCTDCHNGILADGLSDKYPAHSGDHINAEGYGSYKVTVNDQVYDDSGVDCKQCHASLDTKLVHDTSVHANVNCNSCHMSDNAEVQKVITGAWSRAENKATYTCSSCHNTLPYLHKKNHLAQSTDRVVCNTCHNGTIIVSEFNAPNGHPTDVVNLHSTCNKCHTSDIATVSNYIYNNLGQDNPAYNCEDCHKEKASDDVRQIGNHNKLHTVNSFLPGSDENCGECHDKDVTVIHKTAKGTAEETANCDACHTNSPKLANTQNVIADNLSIKADRAGYTCKSCHDNAGNHNHPVAAIGYGANGQTECQTCHATNADGSSELVVVHQKAADAGKIADFGCDTCHNPQYEGANKVITKDGTIDMQKQGSTAISCVSCHAQYHLSLYPKHDSKMIETIFEDDNVCDTCHQTSLVSVHELEKVRCEQCHASSDNRVRNAISSRKTLCWSCHSGYHEDLDEAHEVEKFASDEKIGCTDCHDRSMSVEHKKQKDKYGNSLACVVCHKSKRERIRNVVNYGSAQCDSCHSIHEDVETVHQAVYSGFENELELECVNCHQNLLHKEHELHQDDQGKQYDCNVCHKSTKENVKLAIKEQKTSCSACHTTPHTDIDKPHTTDYFNGKELDCSVCHSNLLNKEHQDREINGKQGDCNTCHGSRDEKVKNAIVKKNAQCEACHEPPHSDVKALTEPHTVDYAKYSFACVGCHSNVLNIEHSKQHRADDKQACVLCHANKDQKVRKSIKAAQASCSNCHQIHTTPTDAHKLMFKANKQTKCASCHAIHKSSGWKAKAAQGRDG